jgi:anti-sigma regulatory factor (Ser/Thr protein kinase)
MGNAAKSLSLTYRAEPETVPRARRAVTDFAQGAGADSRQVDAVRLASSEAITNAVAHAYRDRPGPVYVTAAVVEGELWVLIADDGCGLEPRTDRPGLGLGLGLISQVSDDLAIVPRASGGTEVRMRFNIAKSEQRRRHAAPDTAFEARTSSQSAQSRHPGPRDRAAATTSHWPS